MPARLVVRGITPQGDASESFIIEGGRARWKSPADSGEAAYSAPRYYTAFGGPIDLTAWFIERLVSAPNQPLELLPGGQARAEKLTTLDVGEGARRQTITAWAVSGLGNAPTPIWTDTRGGFFGFHVGLAWLPRVMSRRLVRSRRRRTSRSRRRWRVSVSSWRELRQPGCVHHVQLYDATRRRFLPDHTVVVTKDRITAVGPWSTTKVPKGSEQIVGRGKTLVPGLWDCHMHVGSDYTGLQELSLGVTSVRDPGNSDAATMDRTKRRASGSLFPRMFTPSRSSMARVCTPRKSRT